MTKRRAHQNTTLTLAPLTVDEALAALLKTPLPKGKKEKPKKRTKKRDT